MSIVADNHSNIIQSIQIRTFIIKYAPLSSNLSICPATPTVPCNTHRSTASQARKRTPTTLRLRLSKPPVPDVPDNDENPTDDEKEDKEEEEEEETQSEDPRFLRTPTPEPEISFRLYERVIINGIKEPIKIKLRNVTTNDMIVSFYRIQYTAKRIAEEYVMKQNCKEIEVANCIAVISSNKCGSSIKITLERETDWREIITLLKELYKEKMSGFSIEITTSFNLLDISTLSSNTSVIRGPAAFIGVSDSQLTTQALASKRALDVKEEVISPSVKSPLYHPAKSPLYRPAKSPRIHEISDDEKLPPTRTRSTATSQQLKKA
ncbi:predicted protein [Histoplasma mississippiense (nom. inval.)]|uniref:predicted protein n=1 Tax=Ajellomyces capsulatus (strain NAm1 / WU24) TaxID=2059318 RepID=UPI000157D49F|nr:predicted protein [Histoplasma mississippiense (nom. inval.)]EDN05382.1 predicted protein [Histoplasma mississippiense (nom. inval.)]